MCFELRNLPDSATLSLVVGFRFKRKPRIFRAGPRLFQPRVSWCLFGSGRENARRPAAARQANETDRAASGVELAAVPLSAQRRRLRGRRPRLDWPSCVLVHDHVHEASSHNRESLNRVTIGLVVSGITSGNTTNLCKRTRQGGTQCKRAARKEPRGANKSSGRRIEGLAGICRAAQQQWGRCVVLLVR